jgi:hypothetical protein
MRGNRLVTGAFSTVTRSTDYMTKVLAAAAKHRADQANAATFLAPVKADLDNIERYWTINTDNALSPSGSKNIFSSHPPFNLVINYGIQMESASYVTMTDTSSEMVYSELPIGSVIANDWNERLVEADEEGHNKRLIQNVELVKMDIQVAVDGDAILETYSFFARDEFPLS